MCKQDFYLGKLISISIHGTNYNKYMRFANSNNYDHYNLKSRNETTILDTFIRSLNIRTIFWQKLIKSICHSYKMNINLLLIQLLFDVSKYLIRINKYVSSVKTIYECINKHAYYLLQSAVHRDKWSIKWKLFSNLICNMRICTLYIL